MKIGFLITNLSSGGAERTTVSLANSFVQSGEDVEIITFENSKSFYPLDKRVKIICADFNEISHSVSLKRLAGSVHRMTALRRLVKSRRLDVLIGMSFALTWYTVYCCAFTKTKSIGTERNNPYSYLATKFNTIMRKVFYRFTDGYVFQTKKSALFFRKKSDKDIIIPNAVFNEKIYKLSPPDTREKIICAVGRLTRQKRFDVLIDSFAIVHKAHPDYRLIIFGEGEDRKTLETQINQYGLSEVVSMPGATESAIETVNIASVFVLSSDMEGMPNALMEAMALGVPCVSTNCDMGPDELIVDDESGILSEVGNAKQIAAAVNRIIENPHLAQKLSENARKLLTANSIEIISKKWLDYIKKIVRN